MSRQKVLTNILLTFAACCSVNCYLLISALPASAGKIAYCWFQSSGYVSGGKVSQRRPTLLDSTPLGTNPTDHSMNASGGHLLLDGDRHHLDIGFDGSVEEDGRFNADDIRNDHSVNFLVPSGNTLVLPAADNHNPLDWLGNNPFVIEWFASTGAVAVRCEKSRTVQEQALKSAHELMTNISGRP